MDTRAFSIEDLNANLSSIAGKPKFTTQSISTTPKDREIAELKRQLHKNPKVTTLDPKDLKIAELKRQLHKNPKVTTLDPKDLKIAELKAKLSELSEKVQSSEYRRPSSEYRRPSSEYRRPSSEYRRPSSEYQTCVLYEESPEIDSEVGQLIYHGSLTLAKAADAFGTIARGFGQLAEAADEGHKTYQSGKMIISPMIENTKSLKWRGD